jgi:hypothetical protein
VVAHHAGGHIRPPQKHPGRDSDLVGVSILGAFSSFFGFDLAFEILGISFEVDHGNHQKAV